MCPGLQDCQGSLSFSTSPGSLCSSASLAIGSRCVVIRGWSGYLTSVPRWNRRSMAFASRTLTAAEKNYAQHETEALALVFGVKHVHQYLYGRMFTIIVTNHQPFIYRVGPQKPIPSLAAARLQQWAILLSAHQYRIKFRKTTKHANADGLSCLPLQTAPGLEVSTEAACFNTGQIEALPISATKLGTACRQDQVISRAMFTRNGWLLKLSPELKPFYRRRSELKVEGNCLLWGTRVVVPRKLQNRVLQELHRNYTGMGRTKIIAHSYIWRLGMDTAIEELVGACDVVKVSNMHHQWPHCILGCVLRNPGRGFMQTLLGPSVVKCSCSYWMPTPNGPKW